MLQSKNTSMTHWKMYLSPKNKYAYAYTEPNDDNPLSH